jgi:hypothetical protein
LTFCPSRLTSRTPLLGEAGHLGDDVVEGPADLLAAGVGHDAEGAVLGAALHDRDEGGRAVGAGLGQAVELLDLREADVDDADGCRLRRSSIISGSRCRVCGPNTRST